eukprot:840073-Rhodomonas_salina.3
MQERNRIETDQRNTRADPRLVETHSPSIDRNTHYSREANDAQPCVDCAGRCCSLASPYSPTRRPSRGARPRTWVPTAIYLAVRRLPRLSWRCGHRLAVRLRTSDPPALPPPSSLDLQHTHPLQTGMVGCDTDQFSGSFSMVGGHGSSADAVPVDRMILSAICVAVGGTVSAWLRSRGDAGPRTAHHRIRNKQGRRVVAAAQHWLEGRPRAPTTQVEAKSIHPHRPGCSRSISGRGC